MNINRLNYEAFFLDYVEGRLSGVQEKELKEFLSAHPDLASELEDYDSVRPGDTEEIIFPAKSGIKKNESELTPVMQLIALMEGDLASQKVLEVEKSIASDKYLKSQSELLQKTKLVPDLSIRFPYKDKLKHQGTILSMWRYAAAAAILIIGLTIVFKNIPDKKQTQVMVQKSTLAIPSATPPVNEQITDKEVPAKNSPPALQSFTKKVIQQEEISEEIASIPVLAAHQVSIPIKDEPSPTEHTLIQENVQTLLASENIFNASDVFDADEWNELRSMSMAQETSWMQQIAKDGLNRLGELTGVQVQIPDKEKQQDVFAFSIGRFEVKHVQGK